MLVIMDIEWIDCERRICPTQIAAIRVDENWNILDRFDQVIRPYSQKAYRWLHAAYRGHRYEEFLNAPTAASVFNRLDAWFSPTDMLCWWNGAVAKIYSALHKILLKSEQRLPARLIAPALQPYLKEMGFADHGGSAYWISDAILLTSNGVEHCSADDVQTIRNLLEHIGLPQGAIANAGISEKKGGNTIFALRSLASNMAEQESCGQGFLIDLKTHTAHRIGCEKIQAKHPNKVLPYLKSVLREDCRPCKCCRDEYWQYSIARAQQNISRMQLSFVYTENYGRALFHKPGCIHVKHTPFPRIRGAVRYKTCVANGYAPCGWCKPKPEDEREPKHVYNDAPHTPTKGRMNPKTGTMISQTYTPNRMEMNAIKRHKAAVRERSTMPDNLTGTESHDAFVLSQSGFVFWSAEGYQNFHLRTCPRLAGLTHIRGFGRFDEAKRYGLTPCKLCKPTQKHDIVASVPIYQQRRQENLEEIDALCSRQGWQYCHKGSAYLIETPVGKWKMIPGTYPLQVYHVNKVKTPYNTEYYHRQHRTFLSMTDTVEYIRRHDGELKKKQRGYLEAGLVTGEAECEVG